MVNKKLIKAAEAVEQYHANVPAIPQPRMPTPLYVTQDRSKGVLLRFKTQEEADIAWRYLSALAEAHADRTHEEQQLECKHAYEALDDKCFVCTLCGHMT